LLVGEVQAVMSVGAAAGQVAGFIAPPLPPALAPPLAFAPPAPPLAFAPPEPFAPPTVALPPVSLLVSPAAPPADSPALESFDWPASAVAEPAWAVVPALAVEPARALSPPLLLPALLGGASVEPPHDAVSAKPATNATLIP
jgi:hypothetical protein